MIEYVSKPENELTEEVPLSDVSHLHIEMGYQCNYRCTFCYQVDFSAKQNMEETIWRDRLRALYPTLKTVHLQGGEPTIMKNCIGMRDLLTSEYPHIKLGITTNGLKFDEKWTEAMIKHGHLVQVSLNAATKKVYDRTMKFGNYDAVMGNLRHFLDEKKRNNRDDLTFQVSSVIVPENVCELADFIDFAADLGANEVKFFTDQVLSPVSDDTDATLKEIEKAYEATRRHPQMKVSGVESFEELYRTRHNLMKKDPEAAKRCKCSRAQDLCQLPWQHIYVKHKGEVTFCCMTWRNVGNLHEQSIEEIWNDAKARQFRRAMMKDNFGFCSPSCLSNRKPDWSLLWSARKFAFTVAEDPDLVMKKAKNKISKFFTYKKMAPTVDGEFESVQPVKKAAKEKVGVEG